MDVYADLKTQLLHINQNVSALLGRINAMPGSSPQSFQSWENICDHVKNQLSEELKEKLKPFVKQEPFIRVTIGKISYD